MLNSKAYWITPDNKILDIGLGTHIDMIIKHPDLFNLNREGIVLTYQKYNELMGVEGKARHEIIMLLLSKGFIRIRLYPNKYWSVSVKEWNNHTKKILSIWAAAAREVKNAGSYMDVIISTHSQLIRDYSVEDLYFKKHIAVSENQKEKYEK